MCEEHEPDPLRPAPFSAAEAKRHSVRGRYIAGTIDGEPVQAYAPPDDSDVETYVGVTAHIDNWRWAGVPFLIRTGKLLPVTATEVLAKLRQAPTGKLPPGSNYLRFRLGPDLSLNLGAQIKRSGPGLESMPVELSAVNAQADNYFPYEILLAGAMHGDLMLFVREDAVEAAWTIVDPVIGERTPLYGYEPGTWGPIEADRLAADIGGWHNPQPS